MKPSKNCYKLIKQFEGCSLKAYKDPVGVITIGYGTTNADSNITGKTITMTTKISQKTADKWLEKAVKKKYTKKVDKWMSTYNFTQNEYDSLVSFAYNIGSIDQLTGNGTRDRKTIASKMLLYTKANGVELVGLVNRRKAEHKLFTKK